LPTLAINKPYNMHVTRFQLPLVTLTNTPVAI
jgi:hypothetical protein